VSLHAKRNKHIVCIAMRPIFSHPTGVRARRMRPIFLFMVVLILRFGTLSLDVVAE
jgi:hypothetical protein